LEASLGFSFSDRSLLEEALTHPSHGGPRAADNQRLEFLGDAVLQLVLSEELFRRFPGHQEGRMTPWRASMVSRPSLAGYARSLGLGDFLRMSDNEERQGGRDRESNLADAFEALVAAVYLDQGREAARAMVLHCCEEDIRALVRDPEQAGNPKSRLQEILQALAPVSPVYEVTGEDGPAHGKEFRVRVLWRGQELGEGTGSTKKAAQSEAAQQALASPVLRALTGG
jgi:ribonuclease-3